MYARGVDGERIDRAIKFSLRSLVSLQVYSEVETVGVEKTDMGGGLANAALLR
jgi:hypothetical protein